MTTLDELREEFRMLDLGYVRKHHPDAIRQAERYNALRDRVDPDDLESIARARKAMRAVRVCAGLPPT